MLITKIESKQNSTIKHLARLAKDKKYRNNINQMVCEGEKMLFEALSSNIKVHTVIIKSGALVSDELLNIKNVENVNWVVESGETLG